MKNILQLYRDNAARAKQPTNLVRNAAEASLYIYDIIDAYWGVSALQVIDAVNAAGDAEVLHVYINSPGGSVFEGRAIMAALARFKGKTVAHIDSLCASAATSIALACTEVEMSQGAFFMIHNASGMAWGDKSELRETADLLEKIEGSIIADYTTKTGKDADEVIAMMDAETWMSADEALEHGFIDTITPAPAKTASAANAANAWNLAAYAKAPPTLAAPAQAVIDSAPPARKAAAALKNSVTLNDAEIAFLEAMIPHHQSAIDMVKSALPAFESDSMVEFAEEILEAQAGEIALMEMWAGVEGGTENKKKMPMKMQAETPDNVVPTPSMKQANANRLALNLAL